MINISINVFVVLMYLTINSLSRDAIELLIKIISLERCFVQAALNIGVPAERGSARSHPAQIHGFGPSAIFELWHSDNKVGPSPCCSQSHNVYGTPSVRSLDPGVGPVHHFWHFYPHMPPIGRGVTRYDPHQSNESFSTAI